MDLRVRYEAVFFIEPCDRPQHSRRLTVSVRRVGMKLMRISSKGSCSVALFDMYMLGDCDDWAR